MARVWVCSLVIASGSSNGLLDLFNGISSFFQALAAIGVSLLILALVTLVVALAWRFWQQGRRPELVIDSFINGSGNADLDKTLPGLNQLMRETLAATLCRMLDHVYHYRDNQAGWERSDFQSSPLPQAANSERFSNLLSHSIDRYPLPEAVTGKRLNDLFISLKAGNSPQFPARFWRSVMAVRGRRIIPTLQSRVADVRDTAMPTAAVVPGLSFEILDLQGKRPAQLYTFWQPAAALSRSLAATPPATSTSATGLFEQPTKETTGGSTGRRKKTTEIPVAAPPANTTQESNYLPLLHYAAQWLAIEMASETLLTDGNRHGKIRTVFRGRFKQSLASAADRSRLANFTGYFHLSAALACPRFPMFYELAIRDFQQAISLDDRWYQPRGNLADTYVMQALETIVQRVPGQEERRVLISRPGSQAKVYLYKAVACYDEALQLLDQQERLQTPPAQTEQGEQQEYESWRTIERRVQLGKSIALLLLGDEENTKRAMRGLKYLRSAQWNLEEERDSQLLYNLACWYALADLWQLDIPEMLILTDENAKQAARRYLIYSLARNSDLWQDAPNDPCLSSLFPNITASQSRDRLLLALAQKDYEVRATSRGQRDLSTLKGKDFEEAALIIRQRVWGDEQM